MKKIYYFDYQFQRDNMNKSKSGKSEVSDSAVKAFVAKKKQMEEQRKGLLYLILLRDVLYGMVL